jgi:hypothetical protein
MSTAKRSDPRKGVPGANLDRGRNPVRGVRVEPELWDAVKAKADEAGTNRNTVVVSLLRGYVAGTIDLPTTDPRE